MFNTFRLSLAVLLAVAATTIRSQASDQFQLYFNGAVANAGLLGGATFDENGDFWLIGFGGEQRIRFLESNGGNWTGTDSVVSGELALFGRADDLAAGNANTNWGGQIGTSPAALLLNPAPLEIEVPTGSGGTQTVVYPAGSLAFIADAVGVPVDTGGNSRPDVAKKIYRYDLRTVLEPTTAQPDYNTARGFAGGSTIGAFGRADWNDVFQPLLSEQDLRNQTGSTGSDGIGRQFAWSSDGQSLYAVDSSSGQGGIYRIDATRHANDADGITRLYSNSGVPSGSFTVRSEPAVVSTSTYDYAPGSSLVGDQIIVEGNIVSGNEGGINVFVDTGGSSLADPTVLFTQEEFRNFADYYSETTTNGTSTSNRSPRYISIADAPNGDLYVYEQQTDVMFRYDTQGRFVKVASEREHNLFQEQVTGSTRGNDDMSNISIRTSTAPGFEVTELVYVDSTINAPIGLLVYQPGDFDRDNDLDADDLSLFSAAIGTRNTAADDANVIFDLNGNEVAERSIDNLDQNYIRHESNGGMIVDWKDVKILQQFAQFPDGDTNFDMTLNFVDLDVMSTNYFTTGQTAATWLTGDFASADPDYLFDAPDVNLVNEVDLAVLADAWINDLGLPAPTESELMSRYSGQFLTDAIVAFDSVGGLPGDYDGDGDVDTADYATWRSSYGANGTGLPADGNSDGLVNAADYTIWRDNAQSVSVVPGDANGDGSVDLLDLDILGQNFGLTPATLAQGDFNGDGSVDLLDLDILGQNFGAMAATAVPEPSSLLLMLAAVTAVGCGRRSALLS